jgi:hypothetical protein
VAQGTKPNNYDETAELEYLNYEEMKLKSLAGQKLDVNNVDLLDMGRPVPVKKKSTSSIKIEVPFINNSEKEDNAIFSH